MGDKPSFSHKILQVTTRGEWRDWLKKHFQSDREIWLAYNKKESGRPRLAYNDAVEEALCFGWIDSTVRKVDAQRFAQRFSRRNPKSGYSRANIVRLRSLVRQKKVQREVLETIGSLLKEKYIFPDDILQVIKANKSAWKNFLKYSDPYKEIRIAYIDGARKRPKEFVKRLKYFIKMTEKNKQIGFGGIHKHYCRS